MLILLFKKHYSSMKNLISKLWDQSLTSKWSFYSSIVCTSLMLVLIWSVFTDFSIKSVFVDSITMFIVDILMIVGLGGYSKIKRNWMKHPWKIELDEISK